MRSMTMLLAAFLVMPAGGAARVLPVPGSYPSIQSAIDAAEQGDTVLVETGTYLENINFLGKDITVAGRYILSTRPCGHLRRRLLTGAHLGMPTRLAASLSYPEKGREQSSKGLPSPGEQGRNGWMSMAQGCIGREEEF